MSFDHYVLANSMTCFFGVSIVSFRVEKNK